MPRAYGCEADQDVDVQLASADEAEDPETGDIVDSSAASPAMLFGSMPAGQLDALRKLGTRLLQEAEKCMPWSSASHCGFRPMRAAGFPHTIAIWHSYIDNATLSWRRNALHESSFMMPRQGLVEKVLRDRVEEMAAPVPASGGCARMLCLLQQRSMLLGTEHAPVTHPPQVLLQWSRRLHGELRGEARQLGIPSPEIEFTTLAHGECAVLFQQTQCLVAPTIIVATVDTMRPRARRNTAEPIRTSPWRRRALMNVILNRAFDSNRALMFEQIYGYHG